MASEHLSINLLDDKEKKISDTVLDWAIYIGRLLVILTEAIALYVFASRFTLDRKLVDLHDEIKKNQAFVGYMQGREETYRRIHEKLKLNKTADDKNARTVALFEEIMHETNKDISIMNFSLSPSSMAVTLQVRSLQPLSEFTNKLKQHPDILSVNVEKIENKTSSAVIVVSYTAKLRQDKE